MKNTFKPLIIFFILAVIALVLGVIGFKQYVPQHPDFAGGSPTVPGSPDNPFYFALQLFFLNSPALIKPVPIPLEIARYLAPIVPIGGAFTLLVALAWEGLGHLRISWMKGHTILCGAGAKAVEIAKRLRKKRERVVIIDNDKENQNLPGLRQLGVDIVIGNALDPSILNHAGLRGVSRLVALTPSPEANIEICKTAYEMRTDKKRESNSKLHLFACVESPELRSYLGSDPIKVGSNSIEEIIPLSFLNRSARKLLRDIAAHLAGRVIDIEERGVFLLIEAVNPYRDELIRAAATMLQIHGENKPTILISGASNDEKISFMDRYPEARSVVDLKWHAGPGTEFLKDHPEVHLDAAIVALSEDALTLEAAQRLHHRHGLPYDRIYPLCWYESILSKKRYQVGEKQAQHLNSQVLFSLALDNGDPIAFDDEQEARELHENYRNNNQGTKWKPWDELTEYEKEINRMVVLHYPVKLAAWQSMHQFTESERFEQLSRAEHMRWWAQKVMDGWRLGNETRPEVRLHRCMIPYDDLNSDDEGNDPRENDRAVVKLALEKYGIVAGI